MRVELFLPAPRRQLLRSFAHRGQVAGLHQGVPDVHVLEQSRVQELEQVSPHRLVSRM